VTRVDIVQAEVGRDLAEDIPGARLEQGPIRLDIQVHRDVDLPDGKAGVDLIQLVAQEAKVLFHTRDVCIGEVGAIELGSGKASAGGRRKGGVHLVKRIWLTETHRVEKVTQTTKRQDEKVDLAHELALGGISMRG
jgi:hypothetical protein